MNAVVVGGGITGLFTAYYLAREGVKVTIVEQGKPAQWSKAAAGVLEFNRYKINRINVKGYAGTYLKMLRQGKARIKTWDWKWLIAYVKNYGREPPSEIWEELRRMGEFSRREYRRLAEEKNDFDYSEEPLCELGVDVEREIEEAKRDPLGPRLEEGQCMGQRALLYLDAAKIATELLADRMTRELADAKFVEARAVEVAGREVRLEGGGKVEGDVVVVAAGWWARKLGLPVAPLKGYGFRTNAKASSTVANWALGIFVVPLSRWTKITGRFDLDGTEDHKPAEKVLNAARGWLGSFDVIDMAVGYRPCTPDGFPIVDVLGGVVVATGACRLGWTFAPALGKKAADLALGREKPGALSAARLR